jgi:hypothetical protein
MDFESCSPSIVRSIKQRDLLNAWLGLFHENAQPALAAYTPGRLNEEERDIVYYRVFATETGPRFMINSESALLSQGHGSINIHNRGTWLDDFLSPELIPIVLPVYRQCALRRLPVYTITRIHDVRGQTIDYQRISLPFFERGVVSDILMSAKLISEASRFELNNLLRIRDKLPIHKIRAVIDRDLALSPRQRQRATAESQIESEIVEL